MPIRDILIALAIMILWSTNNTFIRMGALEIPALMFLAIRLGLSGLIFLPWAQKLEKHQIKPLFLYGFFFAFLHYLTLYLSLIYIEASTSMIIAQTTTAFATILGVLLFKERIGLHTITGLIIAYAGIAIIFYKPTADFHLGGSLLMLVSAFFFACGSAAASKIKGMNAGSMIAYLFLGAFPFIALGSLLFETNHIESLQNAPLLILGAILLFQAIVISFTQFYWKEILTRNPVNKVSAFILTMPAFGIASAYLLLGETLGWVEIIGGIITFIGVAIITIRRVKKQPDLPKA